MKDLFDQLNDMEISILIDHSISYIPTKNLLYYNDVVKSEGGYYGFDYGDISDFIKFSTDICIFFKQNILYSEMLCRIITDFYTNFNYYMLLNVDFIIITIYDIPFIVLRNFIEFKRNKKNKTSGRSIILEISKLRYNCLAYMEDDSYFDNNPIPNYFYRIYSKIILNRTKNINI